MIDGLWLLQWSIEGTERSGVIVVNEGRALGGNAGFICTGMLSATGENVIGQLHIRQVNQALPPILPADRLPAEDRRHAARRPHRHRGRHSGSSGIDRADPRDPACRVATGRADIGHLHSIE